MWGHLRLGDFEDRVPQVIKVQAMGGVTWQGRMIGVIFGAYVGGFSLEHECLCLFAGWLQGFLVSFLECGSATFLGRKAQSFKVC